MSLISNLFIHSIRDVAVVTVSEKKLLDTYKVQQLASDLQELVEVRNERKLILDLTKVSQISPAVVRVLLELKERADEAKGKVVLCGLQPEVKKLAKIADLHKVFSCYNDEEGALRAFGMTTAG